MGADLYIRSRFEALQEQHKGDFEAAIKRRDEARTPSQAEHAQGEVARVFHAMHPPTAYFRDPYNAHSVLAQLGLSWWRDVAPRCDVEDRLDFESVMWLRDEVRSRRLGCGRDATYEQQVVGELANRVAGSDGGNATPLAAEQSADDVEWFLGRKVALLTFLEACLDLKEEPVCSL